MYDIRSRSSIDTSCTPSGRPPVERHGDDRGVLERPAHAVAVPQLLQRVGLALQRPQRHVRRDIDEVADPHGDAVDEGCRHPAVGRHAHPQLEAGDAAVLADIAEADGLDEVSLEKHGGALSAEGRSRRLFGCRGQTAHRHAVSSTLPQLVCFEHKWALCARKKIGCPVGDAPTMPGGVLKFRLTQPLTLTVRCRTPCEQEVQCAPRQRSPRSARAQRQTVAADTPGAAPRQPSLPAQTRRSSASIAAAVRSSGGRYTSRTCSTESRVALVETLSAADHAAVAPVQRSCDRAQPGLELAVHERPALLAHPAELVAQRRAVGERSIGEMSQIGCRERGIRRGIAAVRPAARGPCSSRTPGTACRS